MSSNSKGNVPTTSGPSSKGSSHSTTSRTTSSATKFPLDIFEFASPKPKKSRYTSDPGSNSKVPTTTVAVKKSIGSKSTKATSTITSSQMILPQTVVSASTPSDPNPPTTAAMQSLMSMFGSLAQKVDTLMTARESAPSSASAPIVNLGSYDAAPVNNECNVQPADANLVSVMRQDDKVQDVLYGMDEHDNHDVDLLQQLDEFYDNAEILGPNLDPKLVKIQNRFASAALDDEKRKDMLEAYPRPENCESLTVTKVNKEIFTKLSRTHQHSDVVYQKIQKSLMAGLTAVVGVADSVNMANITNHHFSNGDILNELVNAMALLNDANVLINNKRRLEHRPDLNYLYKGLATDDSSNPQWLYGDDLSTRVKDISETNKITARLSQRSNNRRQYHPYRRQESRSYRPYQRNQQYYGNDRRQFQRDNYWQDRRDWGRGGRRVPQARYGGAQRGRNRRDNRRPSVKVSGGDYIAGTIAYCLDEWQKLTSDSFILETVVGYKIEFVNEPFQCAKPHTYINLNDEMRMYLRQEITELEKQNVVEKTVHSQSEFLSNVFLTGKKDGSYRLILNLSDLNQFVAYRHFKMDSIETVLELIRPNYYLASIDLRHAYFSIPIDESYRRYLRFEFDGQLYQFRSLANGLSSAPYAFTKLLKPVYAYLRQRGVIASGYIDDTIILAHSHAECVESVESTVKLLSSLGFFIHEKKSVLLPCQELEHLGFVVNTVSMTVRLTDAKKKKLTEKCRAVLKKRDLTVRQLAELIGLIVSSFPGARYGPLHYRALEWDKDAALKLSHGDYDAPMYICSRSRTEIDWWIANVNSQVRYITNKKFDFVIASDASKLGWGGVLYDASANLITTVGNRWTGQQSLEHINLLEMKAAYNALRALLPDHRHIHVNLQMDNTTAISYVSHMGGSRSAELNDMAKAIWNWCIEADIWLTASFIPGKLNTVADYKSRVFISDNTEWMLSPSVFKYVTNVLGEPSIDLFAAHDNYQMMPYVSWTPDVNAFHVDAFTLDWSKHKFYIFCPFRLIGQVLKKVESDQSSGIIIVPEWPTKAWFSILTRLLVKPPLNLHWTHDLVTLPSQPSTVHPLGRKLRLIACLISGRN